LVITSLTLLAPGGGSDGGIYCVVGLIIIGLTTTVIAALFGLIRSSVYGTGIAVLTSAFVGAIVLVATEPASPASASNQKDDVERASMKYLYCWLVTALLAVASLVRVVISRMKQVG
jgi:hypothetical protein